MSLECTIEVGPVRLRVTPSLPLHVYHAVKKSLTYEVYNYQFTKLYKQYGWDGKKTLFLKDQTAPAGLYLRLRGLLEKDHKATVRTTYINNYFPKGDAEINGITLMKFQKEAVKAAVQNRRGVIQAPVRAGKTAITAAILNRIGHSPAMVVTSGTDLVRQTRKDIAEYLQCPVGVFSEGLFEPGDILVTSYQALTVVLASFAEVHCRGGIRRTSKNTLVRNDWVLSFVKSAKVVVLDECHHALAPKNKYLMNALTSAGYVIGLSGTPYPDKFTTLEVEAAVGARIFSVQYETLIKNKRLAQPKIIVYALPYRWYTVGLSQFSDVYAANVVDNIYRNTFIAELVNKLHEAEKTTFVMIRQLAHGPVLQELIPGSVFVHGNIDSNRRADLYKALQEKSIPCVIATVGKEGLNIPKLDAVINAEGLSSSVITLQKMRSLTAAEGKTHGIVIDFLDRGAHLNRHSKKRIRLYTERVGKNSVTVRNVATTHFNMEGTRWQQLV